MKRLTLILAFLVSLTSFGQNKGEISISFATGENDMIMFQQLVGAGSHDGKGFYSLGVNYIMPLNQSLDLEIGLTLGQHNFLISGAPGIEFTPVNEKVFILSSPVLVRLNFWKYFFINAGALVDMDFSSSTYLDSQTGIGAKLGIGFGYRFNSGFGIYINPNLQSHSLIPFSNDNHHERLFESGITLGISCKL